MMNTNNPYYGVFDTDSISLSVRSTQRKVYGREPKICKDPELWFSEIRTISKEGEGAYNKKSHSFSYDNCRDIISAIKELELDIERYREIGIVTIHHEHAADAQENFFKVAINCEKKIEELREFL